MNFDNTDICTVDPRSDAERAAMDEDFEASFEAQGLRPMWDDFNLSFSL